ncbi:MAG: hypothetical protein PHR24_03870 [Oscillospiraceae bacterium]|nr:hypothetical protein [Oscillospiraceae bacterium]MDD4546410.1 hypothetical protein [Oscillospiraceae bacterium]
MTVMILLSNKNQDIFAVCFPPYSVVVVGGLLLENSIRTPALRKNNTIQQTGVAFVQPLFIMYYTNSDYKTTNKSSKKL